MASLKKIQHAVRDSSAISFESSARIKEGSRASTDLSGKPVSLFEFLCHTYLFRHSTSHKRDGNLRPPSCIHI